jgi:hypothetical protein
MASMGWTGVGGPCQEPVLEFLHSAHYGVTRPRAWFEGNAEGSGPGWAAGEQKGPRRMHEFPQRTLGGRFVGSCLLNWP